MKREFRKLMSMEEWLKKVEREDTEKEFRNVDTIKERSRCRKVILDLCEKKSLTLQQLWKGRLELSDGLRKQLKKMIYEGEKNASI